MWKRRACSLLLALMVAMTAIPFSAVPVYSQEAETIQDASDRETTGQEEALMQQAAQDEAEQASEEDPGTEEASEKEADIEEGAADSDVQPQNPEDTQEEAVSSDDAAGEEDAEASEDEQDAAAVEENADDEQKAAEDDTDAASENEARPSAPANETQVPDQAVTQDPAMGTVPENALTEGEPNEDGGRIWFDINDSRIFSDGTYSFDLHTEDIPGDYDVRVTVGHYDDNGLVEAYAEGQEYDFDGSKLTLYGDRLFQRGYHWFGLEVQAVSRQDGHVLCGNGFGGFETLEARARYDFAEDKEMLPGWYATINHWERVFVENTEYPDGMDLSYETTNVSIESQDPAESGKEVLSLEVHYPDGDTSSDDYWWDYVAQNTGTAVVRVDYKDIDGNAQSYTFDVYVKGDVYGVRVSAEDGSTVTRPGGTINLVTDVWHHSGDEEQEGVTDNLVYAWNLKAVGDNPDPEDFASLQESDGGKKASVTFSTQVESDKPWSELDAEVFIYTGSVAEENKVGYASIRLSVADSYTELWPAQIDSYADVGTTQNVTAEFRLYPGSDDREYDLVSPEDGTVTYYWYYDNNAFRVYDKDGNQVGNEDENGAYIGSDASTGPSCSFTIYRRRQWDTDILLKACWKNADGEEFWEERHFHMEERYYKVWVDVENDRVFSDANPSYPVIVDGVSEEAVYGTDYNIDLKIGPLGDHGISDTFTEGVEYTFDGKNLTFDGQKLAAYGLQDDQMIGADLTLILGDEEVWVENRDFRFREARADYEREYDRDMLTGWDGSVNGHYNVHLENGQYPDGYESEYIVQDVKIISDEPWDGEDGPVIDDFHRDQDENDPSNFWWYYHVNNRGKATLEVTFQDLNGEEQKYTFDLNVGDDVYHVHMDSVDKDRQGLPGDTFELYADGHHEYYDEDGHHHDDTEGLSYQWKIEEGSEYARLEVDQEDSAKARLCLNEELPEGRDWIDEMIRVSVRILDGEGNETGGNDQSEFWVKSEFFEIWPLSLDSDLDIGASIEDVEFEVRRYSADKENYEVIDDQYDVQYEWHYDENALTVTDGEDTVIADGETAEGNTFTFTRKREWHTDFSVRAFWTEGRDNDQDAFGDYWFNDKYYEIRFFNDEDTIRSDETKSFAVDTAGLGQLDAQIFLIVNYQSGEDPDDINSFTDMTEGVEYTIDPSGTSVTVDGGKVEKRLTESAFDKDAFNIGAAIVINGEIYGNSWRWCHVNLERTGKENQEISASDLTMTMFDTATASVEGAQGTLTFTSGDTDVVTVDAESGELTPVAPGTAQITVDAAETDEYNAASTTFSVTVIKLDLKNATFKGTIPSGGFVYDGTPKIPQIELTYKGITLVEGTDYTITFPYNDNINARNVLIRLIGQGKCSGTIERSYLINRASISEAQVEGFEDTRTYTGQAQTQTFTVKLGDKVLRRNTDYAVHYNNNNNVNVGTATVDIIGIGNYSAGIHLTFTIEPASIESAEVSGIEDRTYNGEEQEQNLVVKLGEKTLTKDTDYTVSYDNNVDAGTATVTITGKGNYTGNVPDAEFTINPVSIETAEVSGIEDRIYNGQAQEQNPVVKLGDTTLAKDTDYTVTYDNNVEEGTVTVIITGKGNYTGTATAEFTISNKIPIADCEISGIEEKTYNGEEQTQTPDVKYGETILEAGTDYEISYNNNVNAGKAEMTVTAKSDKCAGTKTIEFTIKKAEISKTEISGIDSKTYNGKNQTPSPVVTFSSTTLKEGTDYTVSHNGNNYTNAGNYTVTINAVEPGNFTGKVDKTFMIDKAAQNFTVKAAAASIDVGKTTKVTASGAKETTKYNFATSNANVAAVNAAGTVTGKAAGTVTITVTTAETANFKAGSKKVTITVNKVLKKPGNCHFIKWNNTKYTGCRIGWNKTAGADGYQTLLSWTDGSHASSTIVKSTVLYRDCTVHPQHVSQMKVRAFYMQNGQRKFGPWSNIEYITPSPAKLTTRNTSSGNNLKVNASWNIIYGCNGYNVFITTNPNGKWYWYQSTSQNATATSAVINKCGGSNLKKNTRYYVRIVTRRKRNGVFCTVPMPANNTYVGSFIIK